MSEQEAAPEATQKPVLRVVRGRPDSVELAALTAVIAALPAAAPSAPGDRQPATSRWVHRPSLLRRPLEHRHGAWHHWQR